MPTLEIINLCKRYRDFSLGPVDLKLEPGLHGVIGANGAGKTTLYRCLMGTVRRDQGIVKLDGARVDDDASARWKQQIGYVGDYFPLFENWSGARNLQTFARFYDHYDDEKVQRLASQFDLNLDQSARHYSTGQRTKLAIIHALCHGARFLLLDEPTAGLDPVSRDTFMELLNRELGESELCVLYATHYVTEIDQLADQLVILDRGRILGCKVKDDLAQHWRKITFRTDQRLGDLPNQVAIRRLSDHAAADSGANLLQDFEVISSNHASTLLFLERLGASHVQCTRLTIEQICVQILKTQLGR